MSGRSRKHNPGISLPVTKRRIKAARRLRAALHGYLEAKSGFREASARAIRVLGHEATDYLIGSYMVQAMGGSECGDEV